MLDFYDEYDVRVRIYGDVRRYFINTPYEHLLDVFDELTVAYIISPPSPFVFWHLCA